MKRLLQKEPTDECVFDEVVEMDAFNTYSSTKHSNHNHTDYLALNDDGKGFRIRRRASTGVGKLDRYTFVLPEAVKTERVKKLESRKRINFRHQHVCPSFSLSHLKTSKNRKCKRRKNIRLKGNQGEENAGDGNERQRRGKHTKRHYHQQQR